MAALGGSSTRHGKPLPAITEEKGDKLPDDGNSMKRILFHKT